jgi:hypothetical protein
MPLWRRHSEQVGEPVTGGVPTLPAAVRSSLGLRPGEKVLAAAQDDVTRVWIAATSWRLIAVADPETPGDDRIEVDRPWLEVDGGAWDPDTTVLSMTWVDGGAGQQWTLRRLTGPGRMPETFRERVSASVVLMREVDLGPGRRARVAIRKALDTRELQDQVLFGRGSRPDDPLLAREVALARAELRDQVGMPPATS